MVALVHRTSGSRGVLRCRLDPPVAPSPGTTTRSNKITQTAELGSRAVSTVKPSHVARGLVDSTTVKTTTGMLCAPWTMDR